MEDFHCLHYLLEVAEPEVDLAEGLVVLEVVLVSPLLLAILERAELESPEVC